MVLAFRLSCGADMPCTLDWFLPEHCYGQAGYVSLDTSGLAIPNALIEGVPKLATFAIVLGAVYMAMFLIDVGASCLEVA
jgi:hypothetical protein